MLARRGQSHWKNSASRGQEEWDEDGCNAALTKFSQRTSDIWDVKARREADCVGHFLKEWPDPHKGLHHTFGPSAR